MLDTSTAQKLPQISRADYKRIKHMDKVTLTGYLYRIYTRGYEAGVKSMTERMKKTDTPADLKDDTAASVEA